MHHLPKVQVSTVYLQRFLQGQASHCEEVDAEVAEVWECALMYRTQSRMEPLMGDRSRLRSRSPWKAKSHEVESARWRNTLEYSVYVLYIFSGQKTVASTVLGAE